MCVRKDVLGHPDCFYSILLFSFVSYIVLCKWNLGLRHEFPFVTFPYPMIFIAIYSQLYAGFKTELLKSLTYPKGIEFLQSSVLTYACHLTGCYIVVI